MFLAPRITKKNIASRKWPSPLPRGDKIFSQSRAINISSLWDETSRGVVATYHAPSAPRQRCHSFHRDLPTSQRKAGSQIHFHRPRLGARAQQARHEQQLQCPRADRLARQGRCFHCEFCRVLSLWYSHSCAAIVSNKRKIGLTRSRLLASSSKLRPFSAGSILTLRNKIEPPASTTSVERTPRKMQSTKLPPSITAPGNWLSIIPAGCLGFRDFSTWAGSAERALRGLLAARCLRSGGAKCL